MIKCLRPLPTEKKSPSELRMFSAQALSSSESSKPIWKQSTRICAATSQCFSWRSVLEAQVRQASSMVKPSAVWSMSATSVAGTFLYTHSSRTRLLSFRLCKSGPFVRWAKSVPRNTILWKNLLSSMPFAVVKSETSVLLGVTVFILSRNLLHCFSKSAISGGTWFISPI